MEKCEKHGCDMEKVFESECNFAGRLLSCPECSREWKDRIEKMGMKARPVSLGQETCIMCGPVCHCKKD